MKNKPKPPSISQIIWTDYTAFIFSLIPIVIWIIYLAWVPSWRKDGPILSPSLAPYFATAALFLSSAAIAVITYRFILLRKTLINGFEVRGRITSVNIRRDRGRVEYTYIYAQKKYRSSVSIHRTKKTLALRNGEKVILKVDGRNPKRAFISHIYND